MGKDAESVCLRKGGDEKGKRKKVFAEMKSGDEKRT
jgi:hypothetical protein